MLTIFHPVANQPTNSKTGHRFVPSDDEDDEEDDDEEEEEEESDTEQTNHHKINTAKEMTAIPTLPMIPPIFVDNKGKSAATTKRVIEPSDDEDSEDPEDDDDDEDSDEEQSHNTTRKQAKGKDETRGKYMLFNPDDN
jgi:hypothetical protein